MQPPKSNFNDLFSFDNLKQDQIKSQTLKQEQMKQQNTVGTNLLQTNPTASLDDIWGTVIQ